ALASSAGSRIIDAPAGIALFPRGCAGRGALLQAASRAGRRLGPVRRVGHPAAGTVHRLPLAVQFGLGDWHAGGREHDHERSHPRDDVTGGAPADRSHHAAQSSVASAEGVGRRKVWVGHSLRLRSGQALSDAFEFGGQAVLACPDLPIRTRTEACSYLRPRLPLRRAGFLAALRAGRRLAAFFRAGLRAAFFFFAGFFLTTFLAGFFLAAFFAAGLRGGLGGPPPPDGRGAAGAGVAGSGCGSIMPGTSASSSSSSSS